MMACMTPHAENDKDQTTNVDSGYDDGPVYRAIEEVPCKESCCQVSIYHSNQDYLKIVQPVPYQ